MIWERAVVPFLFYSPANWICMSKESLKSLEDLQFLFLRAAFSISHSCPRPILLFDTKTLSMELIVAREKLLFGFHLENLPNDSLGNEVWNTLKHLNLPGLYKETRELMSDLGIDSMRNYSKHQWKTKVNSAVDEANHKSLLNQIKTYKKLNYDELTKEEYEVKDYINKLPLAKSRTFMHYRAKMLKGFKMNFQSDPIFEKENFKCVCGRISSQNHALNSCDLYEDLLDIHDTESTEGLIDFFDAVLQRKQEEDDKKLSQ